jgi:diadenosine tetraphosphate (Ap4A) HIT family hydrolase
MTATLEEFRTKFKLDTLTILRLSHWTWSVRPTHSTLGAGVLSLNRFCTSFGDMTPDEAAELSELTRKVETGLRTVFQAEKFNYLMLMMVDAHLHCHVFPRYQSVRHFGGIAWQDTAVWPGPPAMKEGEAYQDSPILTDIRDALRAAIAA